jgi:alcohol dehydrogenase (cytochrome c)
MPATDTWVFTVGKDGVLWKLDRETGLYLGHAETVFQNVWASFDPETGRRVTGQDILEHQVGEWIDGCPSTRAATTGRR